MVLRRIEIDHFVARTALDDDPEYDSSIIYGMYPNTRQYSFGLELVF